MIFTTVEFAIFFLAVLVLNGYLRGHGLVYKLFLLEANVIFYASFDARFLPLIFLVAAISWVGGHLMAYLPDTARRRWWLALGILLSLSPLAFFKYSEFFATTVLPLFWQPGFPVMDMLFPVGVSFVNSSNKCITHQLFSIRAG